MPDEPNVSTPEVDGTIEPDVQPQTDPTASEEITEPDNQDDGITEPQVDGDLEEQSKAFFQKGYQDTLAELKALRQEQAQPNPPEKSEPEVRPDEFLDLNTPEGVDQLRKDIISDMKAQREQDNYNAELKNANASLASWQKANGIKDKVMIDAIQKVANDFPYGSPAVIGEYVMQHIRMGAAEVRYQKRLATETRDAAEKAKNLKGVVQPQPGSPPSPQPETEKTPSQAMNDRFKADAEKASANRIF